MNHKYTNAEAAKLIEKAIGFIQKEQNVTQAYIQDLIGYQYLTRAKNYAIYKARTIYHKTRQEVLQLIISKFNLNLDDQNNFSFKDIETLPKPRTSPTDENIITENIYHYILYYYQIDNARINRAYFQIINSTKVVARFTDDKHPYVPWEGNYKVVGANAFITIEKKGNFHPLMATMSLFTGGQKYGHEIILSTYSTGLTNGNCVAGFALFEKIDDKGIIDTLQTEDGLQWLRNEPISDYIHAFLFETSKKSSRYLPKDEKDLPIKTVPKTLVGDYHFFYIKRNNQNNITKETLTIKKNRQAKLVLSKIQYSGMVMLVKSAGDTLTLHIGLKEKKDNILQDEYPLYMNMSVDKSLIAGTDNENNLYLSGIAFGRTSDTNLPTALPFLLVNKARIADEALDNVILQRYFGQFNNDRFVGNSCTELKKLVDEVKQKFKERKHSNNEEREHHTIWNRIVGVYRTYYATGSGVSQIIYKVDYTGNTIGKGKKLNYKGKVKLVNGGRTLTVATQYIDDDEHEFKHYLSLESFYDHKNLKGTYAGCGLHMKPSAGYTYWQKITAINYDDLEPSVYNYNSEEYKTFCKEEPAIVSFLKGDTDDFLHFPPKE